MSFSTTARQPCATTAAAPNPRAARPNDDVLPRATSVDSEPGNQVTTDDTAHAVHSSTAARREADLAGPHSKTIRRDVDSAEPRPIAALLDAQDAEPHPMAVSCGADRAEWSSQAARLDANSAGRRSMTARCGAVVAVAATMMATTAMFAPTTLAASPARNESASAATAVVDLTARGAGSADRLPADFEAVVGYAPGIERGLLVNPSGSCSSPVPLPEEFELACKAHDLGYDLLRYADRTGAPLGPWARQAIDTTLDRHMQEACTTRSTPIGRAQCFAMADIADVFVDLNSRRQDYGAPIAESGFNSWHFGIATLVALALTALATLPSSRHRRTSATGHQSAGHCPAPAAARNSRRSAGHHCTPAPAGPIALAGAPA
ncbi:hypothetical protein ACFVMC_12065 [Nocardia sp. NPDC127579]|uniref:hypothetical protein n=1 Tax=Nocardia sp. NPDC127579 TaxID=3345402 RepID=UPI003634B6CE